MTVWLYELLDASMTYGDKKGMFRQAGTNTTIKVFAGARGGKCFYDVEIFP